MRILGKTVVLSLLASASFPAVARAQDAARATAPQPAGEQAQAGGLSEIIVTAQKRSENVQNVPLAVTALGSDLLNERHITDTASLVAVVPNVGFNNAIGETRIAIRGITFDSIFATAGEARVPFHLDGVYLSRTGNINGVFFDVERIEVMRGPQGTLFGRNAIAGAVNLITRDPTDHFEGYLQADVGNYNAITVEGAMSGPLSDTISVRIAGRSSDHDGYGHNATTGNTFDNLHQRDIRGKIKFQPTPDVKLVLSADYSRRSDNSGLAISGFPFPGGLTTLALGGVVPQGPDFRTILSDTDPHTFLEFYGFGANLDWDLGNGVSLASITSYRHGAEAFDVDNDYTAVRLLSPSQFGSREHQFSQELRVSKKFDRGNVMVGGFVFTEDYFGGSHVSFNTALLGGADFLLDGIRYGGEQKTLALAVFAQGTYDVTDRLHLTLGGRYSKDRKQRLNAYQDFRLVPADPSLNCRQPCASSLISPTAIIPFVSRSWEDFSPHVTLQYDLAQHVNIYATFSKGFKGGGYSLGLDADNLGSPDKIGFDPETLKNYELGFKGDFLDRRLRTNLAAFYYKYSNLQVFQTTAGFGATIRNAATARLYGIEAEITALPLPDLQINFSGSLMKSEFTDFLNFDPSRPNGPNGDPSEPFNLKGNRLPSAPSYTASYGIQYAIHTTHGKFIPRLEGYSQSKIYYSEFNIDSVAARPQTIINAYLNWESDNKSLYGSLYIRNAFNVFRPAGALLNSGFGGYTVQTSFIAPRTFGAKIGVRF